MNAQRQNSLPSYFQLGKFRIESLLGAGGFGITYKAWDTALHQIRAIKEYLPDEFAVRDEGGMVRAKSPDHEEDFAWGLKRFLVEARTLARFDHPNIQRVLDLFEQNGTAYMVMTYYAGESLQQRINEHRAAQSEEEMLAFVRPLLQGLAAVHAESVLHLDIKPANIHIRHDTQAPVLLDFGAAKNILTSHSRSIDGVYTPGYSAIEQYHEAGRKGPWTDIYALGATLYRMITGVVPPRSPGRVENDTLVAAVEAGRGRYTQPFLAAIDAALRVSFRERPQTCAEWERLLMGDTATGAAIVEQRDAAQDDASPSSRENESFDGAASDSEASFYPSRERDTLRCAEAGLAAKPPTWTPRTSIDSGSELGKGPQSAVTFTAKPLDREGRGKWRPAMVDLERTKVSTSAGGAGLPLWLWWAAAITAFASGLVGGGAWNYARYGGPPVEGAVRMSTPRQDALTAQQSAVSMRERLESTRKEIDEQVVQGNAQVERTRSALRGAKNASERRRIEGEISELTLRSQVSASLREIAERALFTESRLSQPYREIAAGDDLLREQAWEKATEAFSRAGTLLERIDGELLLVRQALDAQLQAQLAQLAWKNTKAKGVTAADGERAKASAVKGEAALVSGAWETATEAFARAATSYRGLSSGSDAR